ncbi:MAG TPA: NADP-dependent malic enzyme [Candidatus Paceibacterota bacterium]|nr:NADP-dependent malic enzyme [Candidatus Paceibacterota bacterium]
MKREDIGKESLKLHKRLKGKIKTGLPIKIKDKNDLSLIYTPGVAAVASYLAKNKYEARDYTIKGNTVAVITDGSAVLGLGNIGPIGALPVMEGKAVLFKVFADIDAFPIVLDTQDVSEIIETIVHIAPAFAGINLEDISAPRCFEIEKRLKERLDIPVMHDDQHGTAIVVTAALLNAAKVVEKKFNTLRVVISGAGAAGVAIAKLLTKAGIADIIMLDSKGIIVRGREKLDGHKEDLADHTNPRGVSGDYYDALRGADAFIGVSGPDVIKGDHISRMNKDAIVFALANPIPEITPEAARKAGALVIATGRSDLPNQVNNSLVFPGVFRGAIDNRVRRITDDMKLEAAKNLAGVVKKPTADKIIPEAFDKGVVQAIAKAIKS